MQCDLGLYLERSKSHSVPMVDYVGVHIKIKEAIYIIMVYAHICIQVPYSTNIASSLPMYNIKE